MKSKHLLLTLLMALFVPWAAMAQTPLMGENFNSMTSLATSYSATDWYAYNAGSGNNWTLNTSSGVSSSKCAQYKWNSSYAANCYLVSTPFDVNAQMEELSVSLYEKTASSTYSETFEVFFVKASDVTDNASITSATKYMVIASASYTNNSSYAEQTGSNNNSALAGQSVRLVIHCTSAKDQHTLYIDDITVTETIASSCSKPDTFEHSDVTHNSATLTWTGGSGTYNVEVKGGEWADWTEILHETTLTTKDLEDLTMATNYQARVQSVCTGENSGWKSTSFTTECGPVGIGYKCGFEGPYTGSYPLPACWTRTGTSTYYPYAYNSGSHLGSYCLYFSGTSSTNASAMLPEIEGGVNGKRLSFYLKVSNTAVSMSVGYLNGTNTFVEVESVAPTTTYSYQLMEVDFANIEGNPTNMVLKFKSTASSTTYYAYIDDLELQETPPCADMQVQASTITATATAYNAATVTWTGAGAATQWKVQCSQDNTFATVDKEVVANTTTANITGLTAETTYYVRIAPFCTENSEYNPWSSNKSFSTPVSCPAPVLAAATNPTAHGATLNWTGTSDHYDVMYRTAAYTEGLVEEFGTSLPTGWTNGSGSLNTETGTATITSGSNWSFGTNCGVFDSHAYFNMYTTHNYWLITPQIAIGTDYPFSFKVAYTKYSSTGTNTAPKANGPHKLYVLISIDEKAHWTVLREYNNTGSEYVLDNISQTGQTVNDISLAAYAGKNAYIAFLGVSSTTDYDNNIHIDDVTVGPGTSHEAGTWANAVTDITASTVVLDDDNKFDPETIYDVKLVGYCPWTSEDTESNTVQFTTSSSCETPSNLQESEVTENSAKISWDGHGLSEFNLRYGTDGTTWTTVNNVANPYTLDGVLENNKAYQVQVQATCNTEEWSTVLNFRTDCGIVTIPANGWKENFNDYTTDVVTSTTPPTTYPNHQLPYCWQFLNLSENTNTYPMVFISSNSGYPVSGNCLFFKSSSTTPLYAILPEFDQEAANLQLTFTYRNEGTSDSNGTLYVGYMTDPAKASTFTPVKTCTKTTTKTEMEVTFENAPAGSYIVFKYEGGSSNNFYLAIDDITVELTPTCKKPSDVAKSNVTNHSATLSWTNGEEGQTAWQIAYKTGATFDPTDAEALATATVINVTTNPYTFDKSLEAATTYYMYVRANCGTVAEPDYSKWSKTVCSFTTSAATPAPSNFIASNFGSRTADLVWTAGGGDYETSWELYYVASATAPTAPDNDTEATKTVNTLPTTEEPYTLGSLTPETRYYIWVRANHGTTDGKSAWTALTGGYFTTDVACPAPTNVAASNITNNSAEISWEGDASSYNLRYGPREVGSFATIILTAGDVWSDGSGYQMLLDADATAYDGDDISDYSIFEYTIPSDAEADPNTNAIVLNNSITIQIPAGTYDWYIVNPSPDYDEIYVAESSGNVGGSQDNYVFEAGKTYEFVPYLQGNSDGVNVTVTYSDIEIEWTVIEGVTSPQPITGLTAETTYEVQVQAVCGGEDGESVWTSLAEPFTTLSNCSAPGELNVTELTNESAKLNWSGAQDSYNVRYRKLIAGEEVENITEDFSGQTPTGYNSTGQLPAGWKSYTTGSYVPHVSNASNYSDYIPDMTGNYLLMTTNTKPGSVYAIMPQYDYITAASFYYAFESSGSCGNLEVGYVTDNTGYSTFTRLQEIEPEDSKVWHSYTLTSADIATINSNNGYIAFKYNSNNSTYYSAALDDVVVSVRALTPGAWVNRDNVTSPLPIEDLEMNTIYQWQVQGINSGCTNSDNETGVTDWSEMASFTTPYPTFTRVINGYGENAGGYVLIASPLAGETDPANVTNMIPTVAANYDLYYFDQAQDLEWINYKDTENGGYNLINGKGYLYANKNTVTLTFTGAPYNGTGVFELTYSAAAQEFPGLNLVGNPFGVQAYISKPYYRMEEGGAEIMSTSSSDAINVMEGVFVIADENGEELTFSTTAPDLSNSANLNLNLSQANRVIDRAIVSFGKGEQLPKFQLNKSNTKVYIPVNGKDYAIANAESNVGEMPVSFEAKNNGTYTLSFTNEEVSFAYLHLIDNMTGIETDLLANPSYTFEARTTDYASRFKLVFATGSSTGSDTFAYYSNGNWVINNEGRATLQVVDVNGRILKSESINGCANVNFKAAAGIYMIRLVNGDNVKVQKVVVR